MDRCAILSFVRTLFLAPGALALGVVLGSSCSAPAFECQSDDQCVGEGQGICQPQGYCSFPNDDCESGQRFAEDGGPFAGKCVPVDDVGTGGVETTSGDSAESSTTEDDPDVLPTTTSADGTSTGVGVDESSDDTTTDASDSSSGSTGEPLDPDLLLWLKFDEATGIYEDSSQYSIAGSCEANSCPETVPGAFGEALSFSGNQEYATWSHASHFEDLEAMTFSAWVLLDAEPTSTGFIVGKPEGTGIYDSFELFFLWLARAGHAVLRYSVSDGIGHPAEIAPPYPIGEWFNVAGTWDGTTCTLWVEGVERHSIACPGYAWSDHPVYVGCDNNAGTINSCFQGSVDDVRLYSRVLTAEEMLSLGTTGAP